MLAELGGEVDRVVHDVISEIVDIVTISLKTDIVKISNERDIVMISSIRDIDGGGR